MGVKISQLPAVTAPALSDILPIVQAGVTYNETCTQLAALIDTTLQAGGKYVLTNAAGSQTIANGLTVNNGLVTATTLTIANPNEGAFGASMTDNTTLTSGSLSAMGGLTYITSNSGCLVSGTVGLLTVTGTLSSGDSQALYGQVVLTDSTINGGTVSSLYCGMVGTGITATNVANVNGLVFNNETAVVANAQILLAGDATYLMDLVGASTYFATSGTSSGSWGNGTPPTPSKVLAIRVGSTTYYLPLVAQNT